MRAKLTVFGSCVLKASVGRHVGRHSTDISIDTRPISRSTVGRYVDRHSADMLADISRLSTDMHVGRYPTDTRPILHRLSVNTLPSLDRLSAPCFSLLKLLSFALPTTLSTNTFGGFCRHQSSMTFLSASVFSSSSLLLQTLWLTELS